MLTIFLLASPQLLSMNVSSGNQGVLTAVTRVRSGLVASDSLTTGNLSYWKMYGNALEENATHSYSENSTGLHIGIQAIKNGTWVGFFAESPKTHAFLFHAKLTLPYNSISNESFNTGMYVQTAAISNVSYVTCDATAEHSGHYWQVVATTGDNYHAVNFHVLYSRPMGPLTQDCTIVTNGNNSLEVYLGGALVYSNQSMDLRIPPPFNVYLEVETTNAQMHFANYSDYYANTFGSIIVTNANPGGVVKLVNRSGDTIAESNALPDGNATISLGAYELPLNASIQVYNSKGLLIASTPKSVSLWGGDVYSVQGGSTASTSVSTQSTSTTTTSTSKSTSHSSSTTSSSQSKSTTQTTTTSDSISTSSSTTRTSTSDSTSTSSSSSTTISSNHDLGQSGQQSTSTSTSTSVSTSSSSIQSSSSSTTSSSASPGYRGTFLDSFLTLSVIIVILGGMIAFFLVRKR